MPTDIPQAKRMMRVRRATTALIAAIGVFCVYFSVSNVIHIIGYSFGDAMQSNRWVGEGAIITFGQRAAYFMVWGIVMCMSWYVFYAAVRFLLSLRAGAFFTVETCKRLQVLGAGLCVFIVANIFLRMIAVGIFTWSNGTGARSLSIWFESSDITIGLCGLGFLVIGWVFYEGAQIAEENKGFV